jgi:hypothetical protein
VGTAAVEWRHVLVKGGHGTTPVQLHGVGRHTGRITGVLDVRMELLPRPLAQQSLDIHLLRSTLRLEADVRADAHAKFVAAAKKWWAEFTAACPLHRQRLVKVGRLSLLMRTRRDSRLPLHAAEASQTHLDPLLRGVPHPEDAVRPRVV